MKKIVIALAVLFMAAPAMADVVISCSPGPGPNDVTISYDASSEANNVRAYALDVTLSNDVTICEVNCVSADYYVYPGSISIDGDGVVTDWGTCAASDAYPGTLGGIDTNGVTLEAGSLYIGEANAPAKSGDLAILTLCGCSNEDVIVSIAENAIRGGVVMEDPTETPNVVINDGCAIDVNTPCAIYCTDPLLCGGQALGDADCDGFVNFIDLGRLKVAFFSTPGAGNWDCCADFNGDLAVNFVDLGILKVNFFSGPHAPATGTQLCPP